MKKTLTILFVAVFFFIGWSVSTRTTTNSSQKSIVEKKVTLVNSPTPTMTLSEAAPSKVLQNNYHIYQAFNNCGPAALSMALSYYGVTKSQEELGQALRPYQNPEGINDDKSVTLDELGEKAKEFNLTSYHRPNGDIQLLKYFISNDIPVITRTWLKENEDIGHYRVVKGYDDSTKTIIQDDSLQGPNLQYSYEAFNTLWEKFNYEYLVLVPENKKAVAEAILGENKNAQIAWKTAAENATKKLSINSEDIYTRFNLSVALYHTGNYKKAVEEFEKVENKLPFRTLWYQIEPIKAYVKIGNDARVFDITEKILNNQNRAFSELYLLRSEIYKKQGSTAYAIQELEKALFYKKNYTQAQEELQTLKNS